MKNKREEGQSLVEFAILLPLLLLIVCGIMDFGWLFYNQLSVQNCCREGARLACVSSADIETGEIEEKVTNRVMESMPDNLRGRSTVIVEFTNEDSPLMGDVRVTVRADMQILTPVLSTINGSDTRELEYIVTMKMES